MPLAKGQAWRSRRAVRWGAMALVCLVAVGIAAWVALPSVIRWALARAAEQATGMRAQVGEVRLSVGRGEARIGELRVTHPRSGMPVAGWEGLRVRVRYAPLLHGAVRVETLEVDRPFIALAGGAERAAGDAIPLAVFTRPRPQGALAPDVDLGHLEIAQGRVRLLDATGPGRTVTLEDLQVRVSDFTTRRAEAGRQTQVAVSARWEGGRIEAVGWVKPLGAPPEGELALRLADLDLSLVSALLLPSPAPPAGAGGPAAGVTVHTGQADVTGRLVRSPSGGTSLTGVVDVRQVAVSLPGGRGRASARSLRFVAGRFDVERRILQDGRVEVKLSISASSDESKLKFLKALEESPSFSRVQVITETRPNRPEQADRVVLQLVAWYEAG